MTPKAVTLWQPWATLIALGVKRYETRSWNTPYRGELVIHAAKKLDADIHADLHIPAVRDVLRQHGITSHLQLPFGAAVCIATMTDCIPTAMIAPRERTFGNFTPGRWAWKLENVRIFAQPVPCPGAQGLWLYTGEIHIPGEQS